MRLEWWQVFTTVKLSCKLVGISVTIVQGMLSEIDHAWDLIDEGGLPVRFLRGAIICLGIFAAAVLLLGCHHSSEYGLPITLGSSSDDVRRVLGSPKDSFKPPQNDRLTIEWYYTHGIVATFERDRLTVISLPNGKLFDYQGFLTYSNEIIRGLRLTDKKQRILDTLGKPTKIETDDLPAGIDPDVPVVWPKESRYYWRLTNYTVEVDFLNQAQSVSEGKKLTLPKDSVTMIVITK